MITADNTKPLKAEIDFHDLQIELAGLETGRIPRFIADNVFGVSSSNRKASKQQAMSRLDMLLMHNNDYAFYAVVNKSTMETIGSQNIF